MLNPSQPTPSSGARQTGDEAAYSKAETAFLEARNTMATEFKKSRGVLAGTLCSSSYQGQQSGQFKAAMLRHAELEVHFRKKFEQLHEFIAQTRKTKTAGDLAASDAIKSASAMLDGVGGSGAIIGALNR
ncbi:hypothetical protein ACQP2F_15605 [Actinoplanes sp. CA-030573]|uniref:hypothetical protein n=1 Tax=Actinoplanes sp. CA-030573 TaxID=3239898 RepID=UPI003D8EA44A